MKLIHSGLILPVCLFAGMAVAAPDPLAWQDDQVGINTTTTVVPETTTVSSPQIYTFNVREEGGHNGQMSIGEKELTFEANNSKHSMAWNYNVLKKITMNRNRTMLTVVLHGGEYHRFKVMGGEQPPDEIVHVVAARIAKAPRYDRSIS